MKDCKLIVKRKNSATWKMGELVQITDVDTNCGKCTLQGFLSSGGLRENSQHVFVEVIVRNVPAENELYKLELDGVGGRKLFRLQPQTTETDPFFTELLTNGIIDIDYTVLVQYIVNDNA